MLKNMVDVARVPETRGGAQAGVVPASRDGDGVRPWWREQLAMLAPAHRDLADRLAQHYAAEVRLAHDLMQDADLLIQYPHQRVGVRDASEHARRRAQRIQRAHEGLERPLIAPVSMTKERENTAWERLRAHLPELARMSDAYLADAYVVIRDHPETARLLFQLHRESAEDRRDLVWILARLGAPERLSERVTAGGLV